MNSFSKPLIVIACLTIGLLGTSLAAPKWTEKVGLDFWNFDEEKDRFEAAEEEEQRLDVVSKRQAVKIALSERLASSVCEERITLDEALDELEAVAHADPDWFANLRSHLCRHGYLPQAAADRDVLARYLRGKIERMEWDAMHSGDPSRASFIRECLARLDEEVMLRRVPFPQGAGPTASSGLH